MRFAVVICDHCGRPVANGVHYEAFTLPAEIADGDPRRTIGACCLDQPFSTQQHPRARAVHARLRAALQETP